ncbi:MAG TPA: plastocyanin/azurin family copper-binding protein [Vicinamibacterales bacterium]
MRIAIALMLFGAAALSAAGSAAGRDAVSTKPAGHTVTMEATSFAPVVLTIRQGDSVTWVNKDPFPHTAASGAAGFGSPIILAGKSWTHTFEKKGEFDYVCTLHPTMKAKLRVK